MSNEIINKPIERSKDLAMLFASWQELNIDFPQTTDELPPTDENPLC